ncbi:MAG: lipid-binding SYLF domain-containing protein [Gammaproteobacteria bacterium]|nr:lipid-binding SYLF domain-containing protein [Gammaproteobacteria bacterium]
MLRQSMTLHARIIAATIALVFVAPVKAQTGELSVPDLVSGTNEVLERQMLESENRRIPADLRSQAKCVAVFPAVVKAGIIIAAKRGNGLISCRQPDSRNWGAPAIFNLTAASVGIQAGIQSASYVFVFLNKKAVDGLLKEKLKFGSDVSIAAGPVGGGANVDTQPAVVSYVRTEGLFAGVDLEGVALTFDEKANADIYTWDADSRQVLLGNQKIPGQFQSFVDTLSRFAP